MEEQNALQAVEVHSQYEWVYASTGVVEGLWPCAGALIAHAAIVAINETARWTRLDNDDNAVLMTAIDARESVDAQCFAADLRMTR